ncbi:MAG TPA: hypothetical protein VK666_29610 [Chryseolinea sp.]|nr:hypothetical protein [Chryseolinea sp.]
MQKEVIGLIPAGGHATRLAPLPCSKELFPIGWQVDDAGNKKPKVVSHYLLDKYKAAGVSKIYFILRKGKWDIPQYYGDGAMTGMDLAYLIMNLPHGHPFTIDQAFPFIKDNMVAFGYPDILFEPHDAFSRLLAKQVATNASVVLGIFPITPDQRWVDLLSFHEDQKIKSIARADSNPLDQRLGWAIALWSPEFSLFMHQFLNDAVKANTFTAAGGKEYTMNHLFQAVLDKGLSIESVVFESGFVLDVGTPDDMIAAQRKALEKL